MRVFLLDISSLIKKYRFDKGDATGTVQKLGNEYYIRPKGAKAGYKATGVEDMLNKLHHIYSISNAKHKL